MEKQAPNIAIDTTLGKDGEYRYYGVPMRWSYVQRKVRSAGMSVAILEGDAPWPDGGPPIYAGVDPPEIFPERL